MKKEKLEVKEYYPRILIISNECLSDASSNGRTLKNFLLGWPREKLAQFYINRGKPDFKICMNYYSVTDSEAVKVFLKKKIHNGLVNPDRGLQKDKGTEDKKGHKIERNALSMFIREIVWNSRRWMDYGFDKWVNAYNPEIVLFQAGDSGFMCDLACNLSDRFNAPLIIYNSEGYYFKDYDYFRAKGIAHIAYPIFRKKFCLSFEKAIKKAYVSIYICDALKKQYDKYFKLPSVVIYTATTNVLDSRLVREKSDGEFTISYLGNMGVGRIESLCEIGNLLNRTAPGTYLDLYGKIPNDEMKRKLESYHGIRYRGFVSYEEVVKVMHESDLLVHVESFDTFYKKDSEFAFSTKLADSLASGTCFLLYAPENMACFQYLRENQAAYVASNKRELEECINMILNKPDERLKFLKNASELVLKNHNVHRNAEKFQKILMEAVEE